MASKLATLILLFGLPCICICQNQPPGGRYVRGPAHPRVYVFVHGVHGSPTDTWKAPNGVYWPNLLVGDPAFADADVYVTGYNTPYSGGSATVSDVAESMFQFMETDQVFRAHREVVFVCHSLGGIVVEQMLLQHHSFGSKVPFIVFYSTPHGGSGLANFFSVFIDDPLLKAMEMGGGNNYLISLERNWAGSEFRIKRYCTFEEKKMTLESWHGLPLSKPVLKFIGGVLVVDPFSATYGCDNINLPVGILEDHMGVVKPDGPRHLSHVVLRNLQMNSPIGPAPPGPVVARFNQPICVFYGEAESGGRAWRKTEVCPIPNVSQLDPGYQQTDFVAAGGGAKSDMGPMSIPPGLEIRADGGYYWAVLGGKHYDDKYQLDTYCGPAAKAGPGCNVKVKIVGHYRVMRTTAVAIERRPPSLQGGNIASSRVASAHH